MLLRYADTPPAVISMLITYYRHAAMLMHYFYFLRVIELRCHAIIFFDGFRCLFFADARADITPSDDCVISWPFPSLITRFCC